MHKSRCASFGLVPKPAKSGAFVEAFALQLGQGYLHFHLRQDQSSIWGIALYRAALNLNNLLHGQLHV